MRAALVEAQAALKAAAGPEGVSVQSDDSSDDEEEMPPLAPAAPHAAGGSGFGGVPPHLANMSPQQLEEVRSTARAQAERARTIAAPHPS